MKKQAQTVIGIVAVLALVGIVLGWRSFTQRRVDEGNQVEIVAYGNHYSFRAPFGWERYPQDKEYYPFVAASVAEYDKAVAKQPYTGMSVIGYNISQEQYDKLAVEGNADLYANVLSATSGAQADQWKIFLEKAEGEHGTYQCREQPSGNISCAWQAKDAGLLFAVVNYSSSPGVRDRYLEDLYKLLNELEIKKL